MSARPFLWGDLEMFLVTARTGTLAAAAKELHVDSATVLRRMAKLEATGGTRLFNRSPRGYALTEAGQDLFAHAQSMEEQALAAWRKVGARDEQPMGVVRVATVDDLAVHLLPELIATFRAKHPNIVVKVDVRTTFHDLAKNEADVALRVIPNRVGATPGADLVARKVARMDSALYASRAYLKRHGRPKTPEDVRGHDIVCLDEAFGILPQEKLMAQLADPTRIALRSRSFLAAHAAIAAGVGLGFVVCFYGEPDRSLERLFTFPETAGQGQLHLITHADTRKNARVRAFVEHAQTRILAMQDRFELG
jgi:DNA-binding transcriptional LysR family regulator